jgi:predicted deacylase
MAECVDTDFLVRSRCRTGGAYNLASVNGIPSILIERGQLSLYPRDHIDADKADVLNIMKHLGMTAGTPVRHEKTRLAETELFSPDSGCWYPESHPGSRFRRGDLLGTVRDYFGNTLHRITAPEDGIIIHQCASLNIIKDGPMLSYGTIV